MPLPQLRIKKCPPHLFFPSKFSQKCPYHLELVLFSVTFKHVFILTKYFLSFVTWGKRLHRRFGKWHAVIDYHPSFTVKLQQIQYRAEPLQNKPKREDDS